MYLKLLIAVVTAGVISGVAVYVADFDDSGRYSSEEIQEITGKSRSCHIERPCCHKKPEPSQTKTSDSQLALAAGLGFGATAKPVDVKTTFGGIVGPSFYCGLSKAKSVKAPCCTSD